MMSSNSSAASQTRQLLEIVAGWPRNFDPRRAIALGFKAESSFEDIIRVHIEDELGHANSATLLAP